MAFGAGAVAAFAVAAALGLVLGVETELEQGIGVLAAHQGDIAAAAAIAAAGTAARDVLLPPEGQAAVAAIACFYEDSDFINKHRKAAEMLATRRPTEKSCGRSRPAARLTETESVGC